MADQYLFDDWFKVSKSAEISECGQYRWWLRRSWVRRDSETKTVCFVMLNPSVADGIVDDPTIRRCIGFTRSWGYSVLSVRNLFPFRATEPRSLLTATEPTGGERGDVELMAAKTADLVIAAWGSWVPFGRDLVALRMLNGKDLHCLGTTKSGSPRHPLYVKGDVEPTIFQTGV